jgi:hypothetical protein
MKMSNSDQPLGLGCSEGLGLAPERAAFERWTASEGGNLTRHAEDPQRYASATVQGRWRAYKAAWDCQQASIDRLMLEWCPDEMTPHQMAEWAKAQVAAPGFDEAALDAALKA